MNAGAHIASFFDEEAARYEASFEDPGPGGQALRSRQASVLRLAGSGPGNALDAGMGPGRLCADLAARGWVVHGVDASAEMVAAARARLPGAAERLVESPIERLPFPGCSFDLATATGVLEFLEDVPAALGELARVLRPGGLTVVTMPNPVSPFGLWRRGLWYPGLRTTKALLRLPRPPRPKRPAPLGRRRLLRALRDAGLRPERHSWASYQVALTPLDEVLPAPSARLADWLERRAGWTGPLLATQLVVAARRQR